MRLLRIHGYKGISVGTTGDTQSGTSSDPMGLPTLSRLSFPLQMSKSIKVAGRFEVGCVPANSLVTKKGQAASSEITKSPRTGCSKWPSSAAAASEEAKRTPSTLSLWRTREQSQRTFSPSC